jgi:hypothetical protein
MEEKRKISKYNNEYNSYLLRIVLKKKFVVDNTIFSHYSIRYMGIS